MASSKEILKMLDGLPGVSFIGTDTLTSIQEQMVDDYQTKYQELTGKTQALSRADPVTLVLYACAVQIYQMELYTDMSAKQSLLKYAFGEYLDNLAALKGITRKSASHAVVTVRFVLSAVRSSAVGIPEGTRVSAGGSIFSRRPNTMRSRRGLITSIWCALVSPKARKATTSSRAQSTRSWIRSRTSITSRAWTQVPEAPTRKATTISGIGSSRHRSGGLSQVRRRRIDTGPASTAIRSATSMSDLRSRERS